MEKFVVNGVEVSFNDLSGRVQKEMYLKDKKKFAKDAIKSQHSLIRTLVLEDEETSSEVLDEGFKQETEMYGADIKKFGNILIFRKLLKNLKYLLSLMMQILEYLLQQMKKLHHKYLMKC